VNLIEWLGRHIEWSRKTFGEGRRVHGLCTHIESELAEIKADPGDLMEWIDVVILALDGAWRAGYTAEEIVTALQKKQEINELRKYPLTAEDEPSFHEK
jgi:hypothetical protein